MLLSTQSKPSGPSPKLHLTHGTLPRHLSPDKLPSKSIPFSTIMSQTYSHTVEVLLPEELHESSWKQVEQALGQYQYSRVIMSLSQVLEGDFFNKYIKSGNISMLSEGRAGLDCLYSLTEGILRLELPKEKYERVGLVGKAIQTEGRKHIKARYVIEINLREPSMVRGKKGFDRILWAFKNVLIESVTWLFFDHNTTTMPNDGDNLPIAIHEPSNRVAAPSITRHRDILVPPLDAPIRSESLDEEDGVDLLEWIGMVTIDSPRLGSSDSIDPFLSRYQVPQREESKSTNLVCIHWHGFMLAYWVRKLFSELLTATMDNSKAWFALSARGFQLEPVNPCDGYTIIRLPNSTQDDDQVVPLSQGLQPEYLLWKAVNTIDRR